MSKNTTIIAGPTKRQWSRSITTCFAALTAWLLCIETHSQTLNAYYTFLYKSSPSDASYKKHGDMRLDFDGKRSVYYSESNFLADSLRKYAYDDNGDIIEGPAYEELTRLRPSTGDITFIDFSSENVIQRYRNAAGDIIGKGSLQQPSWIITDTTTTYNGYTMRKATGNYLGRKWIIGYTEEIPASVGPWMLWGAPGLILYAKDSEGLFFFSCSFIEETSRPSRYDSRMESLYLRKKRKHHFIFEELPMKKAESLNLQIRTDMKLEMQLTGTLAIRGTDKNGKEVDMSKYYKYIPLIPANYWK